MLFSFETRSYSNVWWLNEKLGSVNSPKYTEVQRNTEKYREVQRSTEKYREVHGGYRITSKACVAGGSSPRKIFVSGSSQKNKRNVNKGLRYAVSCCNIGLNFMVPILYGAPRAGCPMLFKGGVVLQVKIV